MATATCAEFLELFVLPLVAGGEMHVGKPIDAEALVTLGQELPHASVPLVAIDEARERVLSQLVVKPPPLVLGEDELSLAAAVHNLLFLAHPDAAGWTMSGSKRAKIIRSAQGFADRPQASTRSQVLARYALLHKLFSIARVDLKISWWTGSATFLGQPAPARLTRWSGLRHVLRNSTRTRYSELFQGADVSAVVASITRRSPLTLLMTDDRGAPLVHWEDAVLVLRDAELARALAYKSLEEGEQRGGPLKQSLLGPARLAAAFDQMLERSPAERDVRDVLAFLIHLHYLFAGSEIDMRSNSPLLVERTSGTRESTRGLSTFLALPAAASAVEATLGEPPGMAEEPRWKARFDSHRKQALDTLGGAVIEALSERLRRHLDAPGGSRDG